jgi:hypothetical protein
MLFTFSNLNETFPSVQVLELLLRVFSYTPN